MSKSRIGQLLLLAGLIGGLSTHLALRSSDFFPVDDAYISYRYAANLAAGDGFVFNVGERVEGYSNFLFVVVLAGLSKIGVTPPLAARLLSLASLAAILAVLTLRFRRCGSLAAIATGFALIISPHTILNTMSGLETVVYAGLIFFAVVLVADRKTRLAAVTLLAIALMRPEGVVFAGALCAVDLFRSRRDWLASIKTWSMFLWFPYTIYFGWRLIYFSHYLPTSIRAKSGLSFDAHQKAVVVYLADAATIYWPLFVILLLSVFSGRFFSGGQLRLLGSIAVLVLGVLFLVTGSGDPYRSILRYLFPLFPVVLLVTAATIDRLLECAQPRAWRRGLRLAVVSLSVVQLGLLADAAVKQFLRLEQVSALHLPIGERLEAGFARTFGQDFVPHESSNHWAGLGQYDLARWLMDNATKDQSFVASQVGIAPYYSGLYVIDSFGLVTAYIADLPGSPGSKLATDFIFDQQPDFFAFKKLPKLTGGIHADVMLLRDPRMRYEYDFVRSFSLGKPVLLLFRKRSEPLGSILVNFTESLAAGLASDCRGSGRAKRRPAGVRRQAGLLSREQRRRLRRDLQPHFSASAENFRGADLMRSWLSFERPVISQRIPRDAVSHEVCFEVQIQPGSSLVFGLDAPIKRPQQHGQKAQFGEPVTVAVDVARPGAEPQRIFSRILDPQRRRKDRRVREIDLDLSTFAGESVEISLRVSASRGARTVESFVEPLVIQRDG